ncbi:YSC1 [Acrasis kona]|uniref:YSC1 n=1 Tax=Acrasis kona TaxID=1008807 RepID=A0AAW2YTE5_9EUKA
MNGRRASDVGLLRLRSDHDEKQKRKNSFTQGLLSHYFHRKNSSPELSSNDKTLKRIISDQNKRLVLYNLTMRENKKHLIDLFEAIKVYEKIKDSYSQINTACRIYNRYLKTDAELQVNVSSDLVSDLQFLEDDKDTLYGKLDVNTFCGVRVEVKKELLEIWNKSQENF